VIVSNVVTLIMRDADMSSPVIRTPVRGVVGFPVLSAIGRIGFLKDGHIALSSPGAPLVDTTAAARLGLYDMPMQNLIPLIEGSSGGHVTTLSLTSSRVSADSLRGSDSSVSVSVGGRTIRLARADVRASLVDTAPVIAVAIGPHLLREADALTLDFGAMAARIVVRPPPPVLPDISYTPGRRTPSAPESVPRELNFIALLFALFIVPKALQRFKIPAAITSLVMGGIASGMGLFPDNPTLHLLATLGIVALFLFAGLEIDGHELRQNIRALTWHAVIWAVLATATAVSAALAFGVSARVAALLALAVVTPSTGFILSSLAGFRLTAAEQRSVKTYAIGSELLALTGLFFVLQSTSVGHLALATAALGGVVLFIPLAFRMFSKLVAPYAPRSEFAFLLMVAVVCAYATRRLGVYYLVGAFLVGVAAQRFRGDHPGMSSERMINALESFGSVFIPFYFFFAGTQIARDQLTPKALLFGLLLVLVLVPIRIGVAGLHRLVALKESFTNSWKVGASLVPTLVFTLVIAGILHDQFDLPSDIAGALVLYTILNTLLPAYVLHGAPPEFENPEGEPDPVHGLTDAAGYIER
jgi:Kef-type K+ transport system membrane component KefB